MDLVLSSVCWFPCAVCGPFCSGLWSLPVAVVSFFTPSFKSALAHTFPCLPSLHPGCMGTFCGPHSGWGHRASFTDCTQVVFLLSLWLGVGRSGDPAVFWDFPPGIDSMVPLSFGVPTGILGFCNFPNHYSELGLGGRAHSPFSFTHQSHTLLPSNSPLSAKPGKCVSGLGVCLCMLLRRLLYYMFI